jgi:hypothetical protein
MASAQKSGERKLDDVAFSLEPHLKPLADILDPFMGSLGT